MCFRCAINHGYNGELSPVPLHPLSRHHAHSYILYGGYEAATLEVTLEGTKTVLKADQILANKLVCYIQPYFSVHCVCIAAHKRGIVEIDFWLDFRVKVTTEELLYFLCRMNMKQCSWAPSKTLASSHIFQKNYYIYSWTENWVHFLGERNSTNN